MVDNEDIDILDYQDIIKNRKPAAAVAAPVEQAPVIDTPALK